MRADSWTSRSQPLIGSLCSGYGGLDFGVLSVFGGTLAWHAEIDPDASRILARHWPGEPTALPLLREHHHRPPT